MFPEIRTKRLSIHDLEASDGPRIFSYRRRPEVARFQFWGTDSVDSIQSYIRALAAVEPGAAARWYQVGLYLLDNDKLIGDCGFRLLDSDPRQAELAITLAPEFQGAGYAAEALPGLLGYLFTTLEEHRVFASVDPQNVSAIQLLERIGMRKEAHFVKSLWFRGQWVDDVIFAMLAEEWSTQGDH